MIITFNSSTYPISEKGEYKLLLSRVHEGVITIERLNKGTWQYFCVLQIGEDKLFRGYHPSYGFLIGELVTGRSGEFSDTFRVSEDRNAIDLMKKDDLRLINSL